MPTLRHQLVSAPDRSPTRWLLLLHGILGQGANWRSFARRFVEAQPEWGVVLPDLRHHGGSQGFAPPDSLESAAADLLALQPLVPGRIAAVVGHSFGGKVALVAGARWPEPLEQLWVLDAAPGERSDGRGSSTTLKVLAWLDGLDRFESRTAFIQAAVQEGLGRDLGAWLAMNLVAEGEQFRFGLPLERIRALLGDHFRTDLWPLLETPRAGTVHHLVVAGRSEVFDATERQRLADAAQRHPAQVVAHLMADVGHWLHTEDPEGTFALLSAGLAR